MSGPTKILVAGCGMTTPWATGVGRDILAGRSRGTRDTTQPFDVVSEECRDRYPDLGAELKRDKGAWMTAVAIRHALEDAGISLTDFDPQRVGLALGSAFAGQLGMIAFAEEVRDQSPRFVSPINFPKTVGNYVAGAMARAFKFTGPNVTVASGAASGLAAIACACGVLADRDADVMIAGGYDLLSEALVRGMSEKHPYAEGACTYVLLRESDPNVKTCRGRIVEWSDMRGDGKEKNAVETVGYAFAAETAVRLICSLETATPGNPAIVSATDQPSSTRLIVESSDD